MFKWIKRGIDSRKKVILDRDEKEPYLNRWYLLHRDSLEDERRDIAYNHLLHQFMKSDDPVWHDHPWNWYHTIVLKGGYWEHTPWGTKWYGPGSMRFVNCHEWRASPENESVSIPSNLHWIEIPEPAKTWTLFTRGKTIKSWGFVPNLSDGKWIRHDLYLSQHRKST